MEINFQAKKRTEGFTLVEILVYAGILAMIILMVLSFFVWATRFNAEIKAMGEALDNARRAMEIITYEIREASSIYTPTTTQNQLSLETARDLPAGEATAFIDFYLCNNRLCLKREFQNPIVLTSNRVQVNNLTFTPVGTVPSSVQIELQVNFKDRAFVNLRSAATLRNY